ncbi:alpha/beta hydrolase fold domain-containing protein [Galbibacter orientalis]|uniref:alpha/beta hydrolase fold domain-containing protein n=1 Tax=Galbibacter orientalis TaxID=453852 RepID=UPI003080B3F2
MLRRYKPLYLLLFTIIANCFILQAQEKPTTIYLIGDSTMADYTGDYDPDKDYMETRYPVTGWGQVFQQFFVDDSLSQIKNLIFGGQVIVDDRARGGRSTRTFFQEGRWRSVFENLQPNDIVIMQFGHNDAAENKPERYVDIEGYKEFLRLYVSQTREKGGLPIILTPVARNYPWENGVLKDVHGDYDIAPKEVAEEMDVNLIDLNRLSQAYFTSKGKDFVTKNYFMNLPAGKYKAYPEGQNDNTHFQPKGAEAIAQLVFNDLKRISSNTIKPKPYTIETTYEKLKKHYPEISPISEDKSSEIISIENVIYKTTKEKDLTADVFIPNKKKENYPAVLLIHGGGWISGSKENQKIMAQKLAENGYVAVSINYTLSTVAPYPQAVLDIKDALKWMRTHGDNLKIDTDKIAVLGASAGAQLATLVGVTPNNPSFKTSSSVSDKVQAIVNIDGITSFIHPEAEESEIAGKWLGGLRNENPTNWKSASPLEYVGENTPPILFVNSAQPRFHAGRDDMILKLDEYNIYAEVHTLPDSPHSFWLMNPWFQPTLKYTLDFLKKTLK